MYVVVGLNTYINKHLFFYKCSFFSLSTCTAYYYNQTSYMHGLFL